MSYTLTSLLQSVSYPWIVLILLCLGWQNKVYAAQKPIPIVIAQVPDDDVTLIRHIPSSSSFSSSPTTTPSFYTIWITLTCLLLGLLFMACYTYWTLTRPMMDNNRIKDKVKVKPLKKKHRRHSSHTPTVSHIEESSSISAHIPTENAFQVLSDTPILHRRSFSSSSSVEYTKPIKRKMRHSQPSLFDTFEASPHVKQVVVSPIKPPSIKERDIARRRSVPSTKSYEPKPVRPTMKKASTPSFPIQRGPTPPYSPTLQSTFAHEPTVMSVHRLATPPPSPKKYQEPQAPFATQTPKLSNASPAPLPDSPTQSPELSETVPMDHIEETIIQARKSSIDTHSLQNYSPFLSTGSGTGTTLDQPFGLFDPFKSTGFSGFGVALLSDNNQVNHNTDSFGWPAKRRSQVESISNTLNLK